MVEPGYGQGIAQAPANERSLARHVAKTYGWMFLGLLITFGTAFYLSTTNLPALMFSGGIFIPIILMVVQFGLVITLTARLGKMRVSTARLTFLLYSALTGVTFSTLLMVYEMSTVMLAFGVACLFFGVMAVAGIVTKRDVSRFGPLIMVGLVTLLVMSLVSFFFRIPALETGICFAGILLFMGITTYDAKKTKDYYYTFANDAAMVEKASIFSAFALYLDFLNIFLYLLRLFGRRD